jgi:hypothetical protein
LGSRSSVPPAVLSAFGPRITAGLPLFLDAHGEHVHDTASWQAVCRVLLHWVHHSRASSSAYAVLTAIAERHLTFANFSPILSTLLAFTTPNAPANANAPANSQSASASASAGGGGGGGVGGWNPIRPTDVLTAMLKLHSRLAGLTLTPYEAEAYDKQSTAASPAASLAVSSAASSPASPPSAGGGGGAGGVATDVKSGSPATGSVTLEVREFEREKEVRRRKMELWLNSLQAFCVLAADTRPDVRLKAIECLQTYGWTAPRSTAQHSTAQHSTAQHSTAQHSTAQHSL